MTTMKGALAGAALACIISGAHSVAARAEPIAHDLILHATSVDILGTFPLVCKDQWEADEVAKFQCAPGEINAGDIFLGGFSVDDTLLALEGSNLEAPIHDFRLRIGLVEFDRSLNRASFFPRAGFDVENGVITGLNGTVYFSIGLGVPWIDFPWSTLPDYFIAPGTFSAFDLTTRIQGTFEIRRSLSEPGTLALLALWSFALLVAPAVRRPDDA